MQIRYGLFSCDSHGHFDKDTWTSRMSRTKWSDRIPHVAEIREEGFEHPVHRWMVDGRLKGNSTCNCPAAMEGRVYPQRWEEVPPKAYDPVQRLKALDEDGVDGEVLFPDYPVFEFSFMPLEDPEFELACVQACNDTVAEWREISDRYVPLAIVPYLSDIRTIVAEVERAVKRGHRGIIMLAEPRTTYKLKHFNDPFWEPLWAACQDLDIPVHWHGSAGLSPHLQLPRWKGFTRAEFHTASTSRLCATHAQLIPNLIFSGVLDRYPRLKWVCAETGFGWVSYVLEACDHEWERGHLWSEGIVTRPSELFHRQIYVDFWFEKAGLELRHEIGVDKIMWESDYPHIASRYPQSWEFVEWVFEGLRVTEEERKKLLYENVVKLYKLS